MQWIYDDGGRAAAGYKGSAGDCVVRAIAIATQRPYQTIYAELNTYARHHEHRGQAGSSAHLGVHKATYRRYLLTLGWRWVPTMGIGTGCRVHLTDGEIPSSGRLIVAVSRHLTAVIDGVIHDTHDPQRGERFRFEGDRYIRLGGGRCVYGYFVGEKD